MTKNQKQRFFESLPYLSGQCCSICGSDVYVRLTYHVLTELAVSCCLYCFTTKEEFNSNSGQAKCTNCGNFVTLYDFKKFNGQWICSPCYFDCHWECAYCHNLFTTDVEHNVVEMNDNTYTLCPQCYDGGSYLVHDYGYNPEFKFHKTDKDKRTLLYFGIELEVESMGNDKATIIKSLPDFVYVKSDSSIEDGFEIVSHPASYGWLRANEDKWNKILEIRKKGWRSFQTTTCGMHIHLSKRAFGNYHLYKFMQMLYNKSNENFILKISQRKKRNLTQWASVKDSEKNLIYKAKRKNYGHNDRHTAVSLSREKSVEVRIFKGTLLPPSFWKNIQFTKAVYDFSLNHTLNQMNEIEFRNYVRFRQKEFPDLHNFMWNETYQGSNYKHQSYVDEE